MVVADFRYHESCIKVFNNRKQAAEMSHELMEIEEQGPLSNPYDEAFAILIDKISDSLIKDKAVYYVKQLRDNSARFYLTKMFLTAHYIIPEEYRNV